MEITDQAIDIIVRILFRAWSCIAHVTPQDIELTATDSTRNGLVPKVALSRQDGQRIKGQ